MDVNGIKYELYPNVSMIVLVLGMVLKRIIFLNPRITLFIYLLPTIPLPILELIIETLGYNSYLIPFTSINI